MTELQHTVTNPELYERLINRLGLALETASVAVRLRDELPQELELRGLSRAELDLIEAYLDKGAQAANTAANAQVRDVEGSFIVSPELAESKKASQPSAKVIWLMDLPRSRVSAKSSRNSSTSFHKR